MRRVLAVAGLAAVAVILACLGAETVLATGSAERPAVLTDDNAQPVAKDFSGNALGGGLIKLQSCRGKYVLIDFYASWCPPCRAEMPNMVNIYEKFHSRGLIMIGITLDDNEATAKAYVKQAGMKWPVLFPGAAVAQTYGVNSIPRTFLLDKEGRIIATNLFGDALSKKLDQLLPETAVKKPEPKPTVPATKQVTPPATKPTVPEPKPVPPEKTGDGGLEFVTMTTEGKTVKLSDYRGSVVLIHFFTTANQECKDAMPDIVKVYDSHHSDGLVVLGVCMTDEKPSKDALAEYGIVWPVTYEPGTGQRNPVAKMFNVSGIPDNMIIDRQGRLAARGLQGAELAAKLGGLMRANAKSTEPAGKQ